MSTKIQEAMKGSAQNIQNPRETMRVLPRWTQPLWTSITGKALADDEPILSWTPSGRTVAAIGTFLASITGSAMALRLGGWWLMVLPFTWLLTVSRVRVIQTGIVHHASHGMLFDSKFWNEFFGELVSLLVWIQPLELYRRDHLPHHAKTATKQDPDLMFLIHVAGLKPGLPQREYWRYFWRTLFSARFHAAYGLARLLANFTEPSRTRIAASILWATLLMAVTARTGSWSLLLFAYVLPVGLFTQMSAWAGLLGLHQWVRLGHGSVSKLEEIASVTSGRFLGEAAPDVALKGIEAVWAWTCWFVRMFTIHTAARLAIVPGDLPSHDWHHWHPISKEWANAAYARREAVVSDAGRFPAYTEIWSAKVAIAETFKRLSELPPTALLGEPLTYRERQNVLLGM